jgi:hypothetical protein
VQIARSMNPAIDVKLRQLKTSRGIGIGSTMADARTRYRIPSQGGGEAGLSRARIKTRNRCTMFYAPTRPYTTVEAIQVGICGAAGIG